MLIPSGTPLSQLRYVVLDTEMTALGQRSNRLLSVGAIAMQGASIRLGEQFYRVVNPGVPVPSAGILVHKLRTEDVAEGHSPHEVLREFHRFSAGAVLVGHFLGFDLDVLKKEMRGLEERLENPAIDIARVYRWILQRRQPGSDLGHAGENVDLATVANAYTLESQDAHHALDDAFLTARLWQRMLHELAAFKVETLGSLLRFGKP
jgi:DNA polymerase III subunit epsilon